MKVYLIVLLMNLNYDIVDVHEQLEESFESCMTLVSTLNKLPPTENGDRMTAYCERRSINTLK